MADSDGRVLSQCSLCNSAFRRPEHLRRHLRSHTDDKPFVCPNCGKGFARSDTLHRHELSHEANGGGPVHQTTDRSFRACFRCATARVRCSGEVVCTRCQSKGLDCEYPNKRRKRSTASNPQDPEGVSASEDGERSAAEYTGRGMVVHQRATQSIPHSTEPATNTHSGDYIDGAEQRMRPDVFHATVDPTTGTLQHQPAQGGAAQHQPGAPSIQQRHESVVFPMTDGVASGWYGASDPQQMLSANHPGATSSFVGQVDAQTSGFDQDFFNQSLNWIPLSVFPSPYGPDIEEAFQYVFPPFSTQQETPGPGLPSNALIIMSPPTHYSPRQFHQDRHDSGTVNANMTATSPSSTDQTPASAASETSSSKAYHDGTGVRDPHRRKSGRKSSKGSRGTPQFSRRPWQERRNTSTFAFPRVDDVIDAWRVAEHTSPLPAETHETIQQYFIQLCAGGSSVFEPFESDFFPSLRVVHACIQLYFEHFHNGFPLVHKPTFLALGSPQPHWLLLLAVAAVGSNYADIAESADFREAFQEFLRRATSLIAEVYRAHDLFIPIAQARLLNLIGLATSSTQQARAHVPRYHVELARSCLEAAILQDFRANNSALVNGVQSATSDSTEQQWLIWVQQESRYRTGYLIWLIDCTLAYLADSRPLCTLDDARAPLPCSEALWDAESAGAWSKLNKGYPIQPSLCSAVETLYMKKSIGSTFSELSHILLIHALYQKTWDTGKHLKQPLSDWVPTAKTRGFQSTPSKDTFWLPSYPLCENWRNSACDCLDVLHWHASSLVAKASGLEHTTVLHLHLARVILLTPFQEIHDLASSLIGRYGKSNTATFFVHDGSYQTQNVAKLPQVRQITWRWLREDQHKARLAMIHAGSVFWHVRRYSTNSFYEPIAIYLASIALWAYGSYKTAALGARGNSTQPKTTTNGGTNPAQRTTDAAHLPGPESADQGSSPQPPPQSPSFPQPQHPPEPPRAASPSVSSTVSSTSDTHPTFIHLDRPCDDEIVTHFVRQGHAMSGNMSNVGDICAAPEKVLKEGAKLLKSRLMAWGVSREYFDRLMALSEAKRG
jgi:hypothetical protein